MKKAIWWIIGIIVVVLIVIFATRGTGKPAETGPVKIGVMLPLTGDGAVYGEPAQKMYQLAADEINQNGGIGGRQMELLVEDSKCTGPAAASAAQKLVNVDKVQVIIGGFCSSESLAAVPVANSAKIALFSAGSSNPGLTNISPFFFRDYPSDASQGSILAEISYSDKGWKNVAFVQEQTDYAAGVYKAFDDKFKSLGGSTTNESFPSETSDFRSILTKIKSEKPDAVFIDTQTPAAAARIFDQMQQLGWKPAMIVDDATSGDLDTMSKYAKFLDGSLTAQFGIDKNNSKFQGMINSYKAKYGDEPPYQSYAQTEYDAVYLIRDAIIQVGYDGQKIASWSRTIKDWDGASGKITILPSGDRDGGHVALLIKGGQVVPYVK